MTDQERIDKLEKKLEEFKKGSWFSRLGWWQKLLAAIVSISMSLGAIGLIFKEAAELIFHKEISAWKTMMVNDMVSAKEDSLILVHIANLRLEVDTLKQTEREGAEYYAVGYRAKKDGSKVTKFYRDWDGNVHYIFPDPLFSTTSYTYYFYNNPDGTKQYSFTK